MSQNQRLPRPPLASSRRPFQLPKTLQVGHFHFFLHLMLCSRMKHVRRHQVRGFNASRISRSVECTWLTLVSDVRPAFRHWFKDVSWTHLRQEQRGQGMVEQGRPRLTMRGGSTAAPVKMSKLAALAKARKQKQSETPASSPRPASTPSTSHNDAFTDTTVRNATPQKSTTQHSMAIRSSNPAESNSNTKITELPENTEAQNLRQDSKAPPSIFARIMCSDSSRSTGPIAHTNPHPQDVTTALASALFGHGQSTQSANVLTGPSPDDIVTKAQSKGFTKQ